MERVGALDGIRGLAVLFVLLYHSGAAVLGGFLLQSGVDLFFVLSGFLITTILVRTRDRSDYFRLFYLRRAVRIFPLYYLVLGAMVAGAALAIAAGVHANLGYPEAQNLLDNQGWGWLYQVNNLIAFEGPNAFPAMSHLWSLSVEEQFYLAWPLVVFFVPRRHLFSVCVGLAAFSMVFRSVSYVVIERDFAYHFTLCRFDGLALGAAGAVVLLTPSLRTRFGPWIDWFARRWWIVLVLLIMPESLALLPGFTILSLAYLGLVLSAKRGPTRRVPEALLAQRLPRPPREVLLRAVHHPVPDHPSRPAVHADRGRARRHDLPRRRHRWGVLRVGPRVVGVVGAPVAEAQGPVRLRVNAG